MTATSALFVRAPWQFALREVTLPPPGPSQALLRVRACGICGSDLTSATDSAHDWAAAGHEIAGEIVEIPAGAPKDLPVGALVAVESSSICGHCPRCRNGEPERCGARPNLWTLPVLGFSRYMLAPLAALVPAPDLDPAAVALAEPAGVAIDLVRTANVRLGDRVAVVGTGPIGLMAAAIARHSGASAVVCIGRAGNAARLALAGRFADEVLILTPDATALERPQGFDRVLVTTPAATIPACLGLLAFGGICAYLGIGGGSGQIAFDANDFHFRKLQLRASFASPGQFLPLALDLLRRGVLPAADLVSHRLPLSEAAAGFALCRDQKAVKVLIEP